MKKIILTLLICLLAFPPAVFGATYYVDKRCVYNGNGSAPGCAAGSGQAGAFNSFGSPCSKAETPPDATIEVVAGSGPYLTTDFPFLSYGYLTSNHNSGTITWNFNGNTVQLDKNLNDGTYEWHQSTTHPTWYYCTGTGGASPAFTITPGSCIVNGSWSATSTNLTAVWTPYGRYATDNWAWGDFDTLGFSTVYVLYNGGANPTGGNPIWATVNKTYVVRNQYATTTYIIKDAILRGGSDSGVRADGPIILWRTQILNSDTQGFLLAAVGATGSGAYDSVFKDCGHRGLEIAAQANAFAYQCHFENVHLAAKIDTDTALTFTFRGNSTKSLLAGGIQHDNATPTLVEDHNIWDLDPRSTHGSNAIALTAGTRRWTTTHATDLPASTATKSGWWYPSIAYGVGDLVIPQGAQYTGFAYRCTVAGNSGGSQPAWSTSLGQTVVDNSATWVTVALSNVVVDPLTNSDFSLQAGPARTTGPEAHAVGLTGNQTDILGNSVNLPYHYNLNIGVDLYKYGYVGPSIKGGKIMSGTLVP